MSRPASTRDRILDTSSRLFNERGFHNVAALRIATALGMSPGHLAYHFKSKDDIAEALFHRLEADLLRSVWDAHLPQGPLTGVDAVRRQIEIFRALWRHRFLFNALARFMAGDNPLRARCQYVEDRFVESMIGVFTDLVERGEMRPVVAPNTWRLVARSIWMLYLSWLRQEQLLHGERPEPEADSIRSGLMQVFSVLQPYLSASLARAMLRETSQALGRPKSAAAARPPARKKVAGTKGATRRPS